MEPEARTPDSDRPASARFDTATYVGIFVALLVGAALYSLARIATRSLTWVAAGVILALALSPVVASLQRRLNCRRAVAVGLLALLLIGGFGLIVAFLGPPAIDEAQRFRADLPDTVRDLYNWPIVGDRLNDADAADRVVEWIDDLPERIDDDTVSSLIEDLLGGLTAALAVALVAVAVLLDGERLIRLSRRLVPEHHRDRADRTGRVFYETLGRYFGGSITVAAMMGVYVLTVGLVLDIPLAPMAALWAMMTSLIPQIGGLLGGLVFGVLALSQGAVIGLIAIALFVAYMNIENHVIQPAIVGRAVDVTPPTSMLAALIGGAAAGVPGAIVATPLVGAAKILAREWRRPT